MSEPAVPSPISVLGIPVHPLLRGEFVGILSKWSVGGKPRRVYNVNAHAMNLAAKHQDFREALIRADLVYCDGAGVQLGARILGSSIPERLTVLDWLDPALAGLTSSSARVFLLGDEPDVVELTAATMSSNHPDLTIVGHHHGFFDRAGSENDEIVDLLNAAKPDVVFVAMGMPTQELWIEANIERLHPSVFVPVGAAFRWYSGVQQRPPEWMRENGLEWLGRLMMEPKRLARRYLVGNPEFMLRVLRERVGSHQ